MSAKKSTPASEAIAFKWVPWRQWPEYMMIAGGIVVLIGLAMDAKQLFFSYLLAFMFFLSLGLGGLLLTMLHHLFDAGWSVPIRRLNEHLACSLPYLGLMFLPLLFFSGTIFSWIGMNPPDHALHAKQVYLNVPFFIVRAFLYFGIWSWLALSLRRASLKQDQDGAVEHTRRMRFLSALGIVLFAFTLTGAAIDWMKSLQYQWFSTMYGVYYFAGSVWTTLAVLFLLMLVLKKEQVLSGVLSARQFHCVGVLMLAFTVFHAYITFSQYFIIWNGAIPEETFWYVLREKGSWWDVGLLMVFGHFLLPFLLLLRIDAKRTTALMIPLCGWFMLMHFMDLSYNIMPVLHPDGFVLHWLDVACWLLIGGVMLKLFVKNLSAYPPYPLKDPRLHEALAHVHEESDAVPVGEAAQS